MTHDEKYKVSRDTIEALLTALRESPDTIQNQCHYQLGYMTQLFSFTLSEVRDEDFEAAIRRIAKSVSAVEFNSQMKKEGGE